jgi:hypothetical protein
MRLKDGPSDGAVGFQACPQGIWCGNDLPGPRYDHRAHAPGLRGHRREPTRHRVMMRGSVVDVVDYLTTSDLKAALSG